MMPEEPLEEASDLKRAEILPFEPGDLVPAYANGAIISHSEDDFVITFTRREQIFASDPESTEKNLKLAIATRVALSHGGMKRFLDAAIKNYGNLREKNPDLPRLKHLVDATDDDHDVEA